MDVPLPMQLLTWIKLMRNRAGKLTKSKPSGSEADEGLSVRDKWIKDNFDNLHSYMRCVAEGKRRKDDQVAESLAQITPTPSAPGPSYATTGYM